MPCEDCSTTPPSTLQSKIFCHHILVNDVDCSSWSSDSCLTMSSSQSLVLDFSELQDSSCKPRNAAIPASQLSLNPAGQQDGLHLPCCNGGRQAMPDTMEHVAITRAHSAPVTCANSPSKKDDSILGSSSGFSATAALMGQELSRRRASCSGLFNTPLPTVCINPFDYALYDDPLAAPPLNIMGSSNYRLTTSNSYTSYSSVVDAPYSENELAFSSSANTGTVLSATCLLPLPTEEHNQPSVHATTFFHPHVAGARNLAKPDLAFGAAAYPTTALSSPVSSPRRHSKILQLEDLEAVSLKVLRQEPLAGRNAGRNLMAALSSETPAVASPLPASALSALSRADVSCHSSPDFPAVSSWAGWEQEHAEGSNAPARRASEGDIGAVFATRRTAPEPCDQLPTTCWPATWRVVATRQQKVDNERKLTLKGIFGMLGGRSRTRPATSLVM